MKTEYRYFFFCNHYGRDGGVTGETNGVITTDSIICTKERIREIEKRLMSERDADVLIFNLQLLSTTTSPDTSNADFLLHTDELTAGVK
jgi:hypothetical protein